MVRQKDGERNLVSIPVVVRLRRGIHQSGQENDWQENAEFFLASLSVVDVSVGAPHRLCLVAAVPRR